MPASPIPPSPHPSQHAIRPHCNRMTSSLSVFMVMTRQSGILGAQRVVDNLATLIVWLAQAGGRLTMPVVCTPFSGWSTHPGDHGRLEWRLVLSILIDDVHEGTQRVSARHGLAGGLHHSDHRLQLCCCILQGVCPPPYPDHISPSALRS